MQKLLIIGAGLSGAMIARALNELKPAAYDIEFLEKSCGVGGRLAYRRIVLPASGTASEKTFGFNHGCENITELLTSLPKDWLSDPSHLVDQNGNLKIPATEIVKELLCDKKVHRNIQVHNLKNETSHQLADQQGTIWEFDQLIITSPPPQALQLVGALLNAQEKEKLNSILYDKVLSCFYVDPTTQDIKMCKGATEWSQIHFEASTEEIKKAFLREYLPQLALSHLVEIKKWRFSQTNLALSQDYLRVKEAPWIWMAGDGFASGAGSGLARSLRSAQVLAKALADS